MTRVHSHVLHFSAPEIVHPGHTRILDKCARCCTSGGWYSTPPSRPNHQTLSIHHGKHHTPLTPQSSDALHFLTWRAPHTPPHTPFIRSSSSNIESTTHPSLASPHHIPHITYISFGWWVGVCAGFALNISFKPEFMLTWILVAAQVKTISSACVLMPMIMSLHSFPSRSCFSF